MDTSTNIAFTVIFAGLALMGVARQLEHEDRDFLTYFLSAVLIIASGAAIYGVWAA